MTPTDPTRVERNDRITHAPLSNPFAPEAHGWSPPSPEPPSEEQLRHELAAALERQRLADIALTNAEHTASRAKQHLETCTAALHAFDTLDADVTSDVVAKLTDGDARPFVSYDLDLRIGQRERCRIEHVAAIRASEQLASAFLPPDGLNDWNDALRALTPAL